MTMKHFSLFTGYGGFDIAAEKCGIKSVGFSEIDKNACAVLKYRWPDVKNYGDITKIDPSGLPDFDLLTGGVPCQSWSIAGKRGGFEDPRGNMWWQFARILKAKQPKWFIAENVQGLLSHDGGKSVGRICEELRACNYAVDTQILNTKEFGLPQNRSRLFIVGFRNDFCVNPDFWHFDFPVPPKTPCRLSDILEDVVDEKYYLSEKIQKRLKLDFNAINKSKNIIGTTKGDECTRFGERDVVYSNQSTVGALKATDYKQPPQLLELTKNASQSYRVYDSEGITTTIASQAGGVGAKTGLYAIPVLTPDRPEKRQNGRRFKDDGEPSFTLTAQDRHGVMIAEATKQGYAVAEEGDSINLSVPNSATRRGRIGKGVAQTLDTGMQQYTLKNMRIRRLTPTECQKLQGLPLNWCDFGINEKGVYKLSDSAKYKLAGNGVSIPVVEAILKNIKN